MKKLFFLITSYSLLNLQCTAQPLSQKGKFTHQDTLRGSIGPERDWWDVLHYDIHVTPDYDAKSINGETTIQYRVIKDKYSDYLQIDLQQPLKIDTIYYDGKLYINYPQKPYYNEGNVWHVPLPKASKNSVHSISIFYHGNPRIAKNPPWDGGWIFTKDAQGRPWMTVACQGLGASVWYPCKDHQSDEPNNGATLSITVDTSLVAVGNGKLKEKKSNDGTTTWTWEVKDPINNYNIIPYIGKYVNFSEVYKGEKGKLDLNYWVLDYNLEKAKSYMPPEVHNMLNAFEHWFGPYPFYEDGYQLIETSHTGMEHQSAVSYGNWYKPGYRGRDGSGTGWGMKWDFIIIHESGHEWFGNNITTNDLADMWVHEGFTNYSETLFIGYIFNEDAANAYNAGIRRGIRNDRPVVAKYNVNDQGSGDMYPKPSNMLHAIRHGLDNDELFRKILRGLNSTFYHKTVTTQQVENYISEKAGFDYSKVFDQYLRTIQVPEFDFHFSIGKKKVFYRYSNCVKGFNLPLTLKNNAAKIKIIPSGQWQTLSLKGSEAELFEKSAIEKMYYVTVVETESKNDK